MKTIWLSLLASLAVLSSSPAQATAVFSASGTLTFKAQSGGGVSLGNVFTITSDSEVTALGYYNVASYYNGGELVALFDNSNNTELASVFVPYSAPDENGYIYANIDPVFLKSGQNYTVVSYADGSPYYVGPVITTGATFKKNLYAFGVDGLTLPTGSFRGVQALFGPNLQISAVPEPSTWVMLLVGFGMTGLVMRKRSKARRAISLTTPKAMGV